jgi:hypothetical protein
MAGIVPAEVPSDTAAANRSRNGTSLNIMDKLAAKRGMMDLLAKVDEGYRPNCALTSRRQLVR